MISKSRYTAFYMALLANVLWASSFAGSKLTLASWGPYSVALMRFLLSSAVLYIGYRLFKLEVKAPTDKKQWVAVSVVGLILGGLYALQLSGLVFVSTGVSAAIMLLAPVILLLLAPVLTKETFEVKKMIAACLGVVGGLTLLADKILLSSEVGIGVLLTLGAAFFLALFTVVNRKFSKDISHTTMTLYSFLIGSVVLAPFALHEYANSLLAPSYAEFGKSSVALLYLAMACTAIPFFIWNKATAMTEAKNLASAMHIKTPFAILIGVFFFGESFEASVVLGTAIVTFALWLSQTGFSFSSLFGSNNIITNFQPDLTIEATNGCDRACKGCYAANIFVGNSKKANHVNHLCGEDLKRVFNEVGRVKLTSIRGGEPTLNPEISKILEVAALNSDQVVLETHGGWIDPKSDLLAVCEKHNIQVKISFDSMHGLSKEDLLFKCGVLNIHSVKYLIAITESSWDEFMKLRWECDWAADERIIFQKKAKTLSELMKPKIGVVKVNGLLESTFNVKGYFLRGSQNA